MKLSDLQSTPSWEWPEGTAQRLRDLLRSDRTSPADLLVAAELAGDSTIINDELVEALLALLTKAKSDELRVRAAISLGPVLEDADTEGFEGADEESAVPITERTYQQILTTLHQLYQDASLPKEVRRRILEAAVRSPQEWHAEAIRAAYASGDDTWRLTAVFCMRYVRGFDKEILHELHSRDGDMHYEAVLAAGNWGLEEAWEHVAALVSAPQTDKALRLAAIDAVSTIRPGAAAALLHPLTKSSDEDIAEAATEALTMAEVLADSSLDSEDSDEEETIP